MFSMSPLKHAPLCVSGTGAIVSAVATAAGRDPVVMGKPHPAMFEEVRKSHPGIDPKRTLMIGDRQDMS